MHSRRRYLAVLGSVVALAGCSDDGEGDGDGDVETASGTAEGAIAFSTPAFDDGETIPERFTGVGADVSPELVVESVPSGAETLALVVDDPDAPSDRPFVHWLLWNVPADVDTVPEDVTQEQTVLDGALQGTNDFDEVGYRGPFPPDGDGPHTYRFTMYAVGAELDLEAGSRRDALEAALDGGVVDTHRITCEFER